MPAGIGETLRQARLAAGLELEDAERTIRIRTRYLGALENEDWDVLPGEAYLRGFLHTYGDYLGLDGAALVDTYNSLGRQAEVEHPAEVPFESPRPLDGNAAWRRVGAIAIGLAAALAALFIVLAITGGNDHPGREGKGHRSGGKAVPGNTSKTTTSTAAPSEASVLLAPTGTVWVCLVDGSGKPLVNGETLSVGDERGPFKDRELKLTLGNGEIRIELNGETVPIPSAAEPVGFDLTSQGAKPLDASARPTCS